MLRSAPYTDTLYVLARTLATARSGSTGGSGYTTSPSTARRSGRTNGLRTTKSLTTWFLSAGVHLRLSRASSNAARSLCQASEDSGGERTDGLGQCKICIRVLTEAQRSAPGTYDLYPPYSLMSRRLNLSLPATLPILGPDACFCFYVRRLSFWDPPPILQWIALAALPPWHNPIRPSTYLPP